jgi:hypothetical protein
MPARELRCEVWVIPEGDQTGENAMECRAIALACVDGGESAGSEDHAVRCPRCVSRCVNTAQMSTALSLDMPSRRGRAQNTRRLGLLRTNTLLSN